MSRLYFLLLAVITSICAISLFWNYRLYHENRRIAKLVPERKNPPAPVKRPDRASLQAKIKEERETLEALTERLHQAQTALDAADNLETLKTNLDKQRTLVADITRRWERAGGRRVSAAELESMKRHLATQIDAEERAVADLKVRRAKLVKTRAPASKPLLQATENQLADRVQLLAELRSQRTALQKQKPRPPESASARRERERLQERLAAETETFEKLKTLYQQGAEISTKDREETRQLADVVQYHESTLRDLEREWNAPEGK